MRGALPRFHQQKGVRTAHGNWRRAVVQRHEGIRRYHAGGRGGEDVFCHHSTIQADGLRSFAEGHNVEFDATKSPKVLQTETLRPVA